MPSNINREEFEKRPEGYRYLTYLQAHIAGEKRSMYVGNTPTLAEQGYDLDFRNWTALWFPKGTPAEFVKRWNTEVNKLLVDKEFVGKVMATLALTPTGGTPEDLSAVLESKRKTGAELARIAKLKFD
jgi:tripartite-type tricarboxylate transporter receptor subunit TctC